MKVCLINNLYPPYARGGAEQVVYKSVQGLLTAGHEVVVITSTPAGTHVWREGKLTIYRYHPLNLFFYTGADRHGLIARFLWHVIDMVNIPAARYVQSVLAAEKPDIVHTHNLMGIGFLLPRMIRRLVIRYVHTVHDVQLVEPSGIILKVREHSRRYTGLIVRSYTGMMKRLFASPDVVISPSQFLLDFYEQRGFFSHSRRVLLRNPAPPSEARPNGRPAPPFEFHSVAAGMKPFRFLYVGQIEEHKGVLFLVQTFLAFLAGNPAAELHIVGTGAQMAELESLARANTKIVLHGKVERDKLPDIFRQADVTIVPSLCYENSPTVIFESFAFGVPVLASRVEGVAELIREGENGWLFATGDVISLRDKLHWCVLHSEGLRLMGQKTIQSLAGLSQEEYIIHLLALYRR